MQLQIKDLSKTYPGGVKALNRVSLDVPTGMFGLLGPNGAGKSSLMRTLATLQEADEGEVRLGEINVLREKDKVKAVLGYLPQEFGFFPKDRAIDLLDHFALLKGIGERRERREATEQLLKRVNLWDARKRKLGTFSGGMKQRFGIAVVLMGRPKLIIVDEPTAGLDPAERNRFHNLLSEIGEDIVVILSTHIVEDVSDLCTNMAIIKEGRILLQSTPSAATAALDGKIWEKRVEKSDLPRYEQECRVISTRLFAGKTILHVFGDRQPGEGFSAVKPTLEDAYFYQLSA
jgi:ABC-type multidrug transport system ATPase subunit